jgi:hypothetical protein
MVVHDCIIQSGKSMQQAAGNSWQCAGPGKKTGRWIVDAS